MGDDKGFGWKDKVEVPESGFALLPEGPAVFEITKLERQRKEFGQFGVINVAVMTFLCCPKEGEGSGEIQVQFGLVLKLGWKIVQLATACGFRKHGDSNEIDPRWWDKFEGATGECVIAHRRYAKKGESKDKSQSDKWTGVSNEITEFVAAEGAGEREF